jgi:hypothetical protein
VRKNPTSKSLLNNNKKEASQKTGLQGEPARQIMREGGGGRTSYMSLAMMILDLHYV